MKEVQTIQKRTIKQVQERKTMGRDRSSTPIQQSTEKGFNHA